MLRWPQHPVVTEWREADRALDHRPWDSVRDHMSHDGDHHWCGRRVTSRSSRDVLLKATVDGGRSL